MIDTIASKNRGRYSEKYLAWMAGDVVVESVDITDAFANFPEAIMINRHAEKFASNYWGFCPSAQPYYFGENIQPLNQKTLDHLEFSHCDAYIEIDQGVITKEYYAPGMQQHSTHALHSVGKSWTSAIWGESLLPHMDKSMETLLPELGGTVYEGITLRQVVDMQVPVVWSEDYTDPDCTVVVSGSAMGFDIRRGPDFTLMDFIPTLVRDPKLSIGDWHYVSANTLLMARLGTQLSGQHCYQNMADFVERLGLEHRSGISGNFHGETSAEGGQNLSLRDLAKLPYAMTNDGAVGNRQALSQAYIDDLFICEDEHCKTWLKGAYAEALPGINYYRNQWYVLNDDAAMGIGSFGQFLLFNRKTEKVIVKYSTYKHGQDFDTASVDIQWLIACILKEG